MSSHCMSIELQKHGKQGDLMYVVQPPDLPSHVPKIIVWDGSMTYLFLCAPDVSVFKSFKQLLVTRTSTTWKVC